MLRGYHLYNKESGSWSCFFCFKQKTAYEIWRDWSSDVCSSDLDLTCVAAGVMAAQGRIGFAAAATACLLGIFVGDLLLFLAGRHLGRPALRRAPLRWLVKPRSEERRVGKECRSRWSRYH